MTLGKLDSEEKNAVLIKYRDLVLATINYYHDNNLLGVNNNEHFERLKIQTEENFQKGRLTKLKQWFRDLTEMQIETRDLKFNQYLQNKTKFNIDIFASYFQRIDKIIAKGKILTDNQFYEINNIVDQLSHAEPIDNKKIETLNSLLRDYEKRKSLKRKLNP